MGLATAAWAAGPSYRTEFRGPPDARRLLSTCEAVSRLVGLANDPRPSLAALERRAERDLAVFTVVARSHGYYGPKLTYVVEHDRTPTRVVVTIEPGPLYLLESFEVRFTGGGEPDPAAVSTVERTRPAFGLGAAAESVKILDTQQRLIDALSQSGFAFAQVTERYVEVDHATHQVHVRLDLASGERVRFGALEVDGLTTIEKAFVLRRVPWQAGDVYDSSQLAELRRRLADTHLFEAVSVDTGRQADARGELPVTIGLHEAKQRGVGAGVFYSSSDGPGMDAFWEHRNVSGRADQLWLGGAVSTQTKSGAVRYRLPDFLAVNQSLASELAFAQEDTEAYDAQQTVVNAALERPLSSTLTLRGGPSFEYGPVDSPDIDQAGLNDRETFELFGFPMLLRYDGSDGLLDPSRGLRAAINVTPHSDVGSDLNFVINKLTASAYLPILGRSSTILASRAAIGSTVGAARGELPANKRFYAGGGGSVRGYAYQLAGPLESDRFPGDPAARNDPLGGRSTVEVGTELRFRLGQRFGLAPFVDGGTVFANTVPTFTDRIFWGAGLGLRYHTGIGPLRLDVATPLDRRSGVDDPVQFYLSLGQSF